MRFNCSSLHCERAAVLHRLRGEVGADVDDLDRRLDVLQLDREGRHDFGHEGELEVLLAVAQDHRGLQVAADRHHGALAADLQRRVGAEHAIEDHAETAVGGDRPARQPFDAEDRVAGLHQRRDLAGHQRRPGSCSSRQAGQAESSKPGNRQPAGSLPAS